MAEEKRVSRRIPARLIADCSRSLHEEFAAERFISFTKDISSQGARLLVHKEVKLGDSLIVSLDIPDYFIPLLVSAEIVWAECRKHKKDESRACTEAGIRFSKIDPFDAGKLEGFLSSAEKNLLAG